MRDTKGNRRALAATSRPALAPVKSALRWGAGHALPGTMLRREARRSGDLQGRLVIESARRDTDGLQDLFEAIRAAGPIHHGAFAHVTVEHQAVKEILSSNDVSTGFRPQRDRVARAFEWAASDTLHPLEPPSLLAVEPPDHTRYRKLVTRVFSVRAVERLRSRTEEIAADLLDDIERTRGSSDAPVDLAERYCSLLPVTVIAEILGVPESERARVLRMGSAAASSLDLGLGWREFRSVERALAEFDAWLTDHLAMLERTPADHLLGQLVAARDEGEGLTDRELKSIAGLVLAAGFETTVNLLSNAIVLLDAHRDQLALLRERPELWGNAVDEALRLDPPVLLTGRMVVRDTEIRGVRLPAGAIVTAVLAGANRDPQVFTDPERFDVTRHNASEHIAFSAGRHYCLGAALARMEGEVGLRALFERYPDLRCVPGARRRPTRILRGFEHLPVALGSSVRPARTGWRDAPAVSPE